jgi:hypothetical protein
MAITYEPLATITLSSALSTPSLVFGSIPNTYTDLRVVLSVSSSAGANVYVRFNGDTGTNYSRTFIYARATTPATSKTTNATQVTISDSGVISSTRFYTIDILSYSGSTYKTALVTAAEGGTNGVGGVAPAVLYWRSTSAISSINLFDSANSWDAETTATLYGIKAV